MECTLGRNDCYCHKSFMSFSSQNACAYKRSMSTNRLFSQHCGFAYCIINIIINRSLKTFPLSALGHRVTSTRSLFILLHQNELSFGFFCWKWDKLQVHCQLQHHKITLRDVTLRAENIYFDFLTFSDPVDQQRPNIYQHPFFDIQEGTITDQRHTFVLSLTK